MTALKIIGMTVWVILIFWFVLSWMDCLAHNDPFDGDYQYHNWNLIQMIVP